VESAKGLAGVELELELELKLAENGRKRLAFVLARAAQQQWLDLML
jgi:hypothetical protein